MIRLDTPPARSVSVCLKELILLPFRTIDTKLYETNSRASRLDQKLRFGQGL